jgi:hypothetical protein
VAERLAHEREVLRRLPPAAFDFAGARPIRVPLDGYLKLGGNFCGASLGLVHQRVELRFDRDQVWIVDRGQLVGPAITSAADIGGATLLMLDPARSARPLRRART